jgi:hypothetical protein
MLGGYLFWQFKSNGFNFDSQKTYPKLNMGFKTKMELELSCGLGFGIRCGIKIWFSNGIEPMVNSKMG